MQISLSSLLPPLLLDFSLLLAVTAAAGPVAVIRRVRTHALPRPCYPVFLFLLLHLPFSFFFFLSLSLSLFLSLTAEFGFYLVGGLWGPLPAARSLLVESKNLHTPGETKGGALSSRTPVV